MPRYVGFNEFIYFFENIHTEQRLSFFCDKFYVEFFAIQHKYLHSFTYCKAIFEDIYIYKMAFYLEYHKEGMPNR